MLLRISIFALVALVASFATALSDPVVVAGGGPAGLFFAQRYLELHPGHSVQIYEPKPDEREKSTRDHYDSAFGFGIGERARCALKQTQQGEKLVEAVGDIAAKTASGLWLVNRQDLCHVLKTHLFKTCGNQVDIIHGARVCGIHEGSEKGKFAVDIKIKRLDEDGQELSITKQVPYSLLVAADGTHSKIRQDLVQKRRKIRQQRFARPVQWKTLQLPTQPNMEPGSFLPFPMTAPREEFGAVMPRYPNRFVALLFWKPTGSKRTWRNPFGCTTIKELKTAVQTTFPNVSHFPPDDELQTYLDMEPGTEYYMKLSRHAVEEMQVALIGDAATGVYSRLAQGCACALWGANLLAEELAYSSAESTDGTSQLSRALQSFSDKSVREGHSLSDLNLLAHIEYTPWLHALNIFQFPLIARIINNADLSYSDIYWKFRWQIKLAKLHWFFSRQRVQE